MKNILIINRKGGVGKTLVADELAFALDAKNVPYCFYDLDGQGGTLHEPVEMDDADISIIDTPGSLQGEMGEWVKDADVVIIPMRPSVTDMPATETTIDLVKCNAPDTPIVYVVNGTNRFNKMIFHQKRVTSDMIGVLTRNTDMLNRKYQAKINETRVKREQIQQGVYFDISDEQDERGDKSL